MDCYDAFIFPGKSTDSGYDSGAFSADDPCAIEEDAANMVVQKDSVPNAGIVSNKHSPFVAAGFTQALHRCAECQLEIDAGADDPIGFHACRSPHCSSVKRPGSAKVEIQTDDSYSITTPGTMLIQSGEDAVVEAEPAIPNSIEPRNGTEDGLLAHSVPSDELRELERKELERDKALKDDVKVNRLLTQNVQKQMSEKFRDYDRRHDDQEEATLAVSRGMEHMNVRVDALESVLKDVKHQLVDVAGYNVVDSECLMYATGPADGDEEAGAQE